MAFLPQSWLMALPFWPKGRKILVQGEVVDEADITPDQKGHFQRPTQAYRAQVLPQGTNSKGRWYLFACYGCPWAHRAILARHVKELEDEIPLLPTEGWWPFSKGLPALATGGWRVDKPLPEESLKGASLDLKSHAQSSPFYLWRLYTATDPSYTGRVTVPFLWDSLEAKIGCNESADVVRILNSYPPSSPKKTPDLYPQDLQKEIDELNPKIYEFNNGVYKCGFAGTTDVYLQSRKQLFEAMDFLEERLVSRRYLCGEALTECDIRCFTTLVRFDTAYYNAFRCNVRRVRDGYPNLQRYLQDLYSLRPFRESTKGMILGYPIMYFCICKWQGRRLANSLRIAELGLFALLQAMAPNTPGWRYWFVRMLALPLRLLNKLVDPVPNVSVI